jgi:hypothetical protein
MHSGGYFDMGAICDGAAELVLQSSEGFVHLRLGLETANAKKLRNASTSAETSIIFMSSYSASMLQSCPPPPSMFSTCLVSRLRVSSVSL